MPNETKDKTTLEKLKELQENDTISSLDFEEPELKHLMLQIFLK